LKNEKTKKFHFLLVFLIALLSLPLFQFVPSVKASNTLIDSYSTTNVDTYATLPAVHPSSNAYQSSAGQSFTMLSSNYNLTSAKFYLKKYKKIY